MAAYVIFTRKGPLKDEIEMAEYVRKFRAGPRDPNLKMRVNNKPLPLEGEAPDSVVILEFPTLADARAWYDSPSYQDAIQHRLRGGDYTAFMVEGL
jgi:uncharacterized protein (DUF1330 family)